MTFAQICVKVRMCYSGRRAISFCCRESMFPNGRRNSSALSGPIDCLNLQSSFLPLTVYGRPAHQEGRRFCTHSLRRLFRCFPGSSHSSWKGALLLSTPAHGSLSYVQARRCVSKQVGRHDAACQGCPQRVSRSPVLGTPQSRTALWGEEKQRSD